MMMLDTFPRSRRGFSLVEVTLALGIVSFAMMTLMALIPAGLSSFQQAASLTVEAQIVQSIRTDIALQKFTDLQDADSTQYYYDSLGGATTARAGDQVYTATLTLQPLSNYDKNSSLYPLDASTAVVAQIEIASKINPKTHRYTILVPNNGQ